MSDGLFPPMEGAASRAQTLHASAGGGIRTTSGFDVAERDPVVSVHVLGILPHLDRPFEYAVPAHLNTVRPGQRVRVRFAGKEREGLVRQRYAAPETDRALAPLVKIVSDDVVITESMFTVCEDVATRYAGSVGDVLRLAVPPRSAAAEKQVQAAREKREQSTVADSSASSRPASDQDSQTDSATYIHKYTGLKALLKHASAHDGVTPRASIVLDPVDSWIALAIETVQALPENAGVLILASDQRDVDRAAHAFAEAELDACVLASSAGPHKRYSSFLSILDGASRIVIGTRSAVFAPVHNLALVLLYDPDDDLFEEPRAPYPHARTVAFSRSTIEKTALLYVAQTPSAHLRIMEQQGTVPRLVPVPVPHALTHPRVELMDEYLRGREGGSGHSRLPQHAYARIREGVTTGPVLVSVPRAGYVPALVCTFCGTRATCRTCHAALAAPGRGSDVLVCRVCGRSHGAYRCEECDRTQLRPLVIGVGRTAEDLKRAFPHVPMHISGGAQGPVSDDAVEHGHIVVSTPGAEPQPDGGYSAALIVDPELALGRAAYDADTEAVRRFSHVIALTRVFVDGGQVLVLGRGPHRALRSLVLPRSFAFIDAVLEERAQLSFPPLSKVVEVRGAPGAVSRFVEEAELPAYAGVFGPLEVDDSEGETRTRVVLRTPTENGMELIHAVRAAAIVHSAKKVPGTLRVQVDPPHVF